MLFLVLKNLWAHVVVLFILSSLMKWSIFVTFPKLIPKGHIIPISKVAYPVLGLV